MSRRIPVLLALVLVAGGTGCGGKAGNGPSQAFVFTVNNEGWNEIWLMDETGKARTQLTASRPIDSQADGNTSPAWSPDGTRIAYTGTGDSNIADPGFEEIYVMDGDGRHVEQLTKNDVPDLSPAWSADGKHIVFSRASKLTAVTPSAALYVMDTDGSNQHELYREQAKASAGGVLLFTPEWSPDGSQIAFTRVSYAGDAAKTAVYVVNSDGTGAREIASDGAEPAWSPDGERIAFSSARDKNGQTCFADCSPSGEIYVAEADGAARRLTNEKAEDSSPSWSPDGTQIAFVSDLSNRSDHENEIYVVDADGGNPRRITNNLVWDLEPDWK
jgi:Tol biopolymer transport system component